MFVSSSLKFCVKFERKPAFNVKCLQFWHIFCEATRVKPWQNTFIDRDKNTEILKRIRLNSRNRKILVISKFLPKKLWNFWYFLVRSSDLYFDIASAILVFTVVRSAFCCRCCAVNLRTGVNNVLAQSQTDQNCGTIQQKTYPAIVNSFGKHNK